MTRPAKSAAPRSCAGCGDTFRGEPWHLHCWACWREQRDGEAIQAAFDRGYTAGYKDAASDHVRRAFQRPSETRFRELAARAVRLTHPDRHWPERADEANAVTAALLEFRA